MSIQSDDCLARYLSSEGWFNGNQVKGEAFRPGKRGNSPLGVSVTRHDGKDSSEVKKRGMAWRDMPGRPKPINFLGWADVSTGAVLAIQPLDLEPAPSRADPNHCNIIGWHLDEGRHMIQAEDVARQAKLFLLPSTS